MAMTAKQVLGELEKMGDAATRKTYLRHGAREPLFGVKVGDLKKIVKKVKVDHALALELWATGNSDAMYLAGLIADDARMTRKDLQLWAEQASWPWLSEYTVPWVATGSAHGWELALEWIESKRENVAATGWATLSSLAGARPDEELDLKQLEKLLKRVGKTIHDQPNRVRYTMNGFVIWVGTMVAPLTALACEVAKACGPVSVDMGGTACKVPSALEYIDKARKAGRIGKKRKNVKC